MVARNPGRYLAPVALIVVAVAVVLIVRATQTHSHHAAAARPPVHHVSVTTRDVPPQQVFYVIKSGDTLSNISVKTGVPVATIEALNPGVNPAALQTGARLRLRRQ